MLSTSRSESVGRRERPLKKMPQIIAGFFIFLYTLFFAYRAFLAITYPYPIAYGEGAVFYEAGQLLRGGFHPAALYVANLNPPYQAAIYNPLFYYLQAFTMLFSGPNSILGGRLITLAASMYIGYTLYRVASKQEVVAGRRGGIGLSLAAALTPFATAAIYAWGVVAKGDMLTIALSLTAVRLVWETDSERRTVGNARAYALAALTCALALLTKQSALAAPAAIVIWFGLSRRWRDLGIFGGILILVIGIVEIPFQVVTGGSFLVHTISYNGQPFVFDYLVIGLTYFVREHFVLLGLAAIWVGRPLIQRYEGLDLWSIYFVCAFAVSFSIGKVGADSNYYIETLCIVSLLAWWQIGRMLALRPDFKLADFRISLAHIALIFMVFQLFQFHHIPTIADATFTPSPRQIEQSAQVATLLKDLPGPIFAEDSGWQTVLNLPVELDDPFVFGELSQTNLWNDTAFMQKLNSGYYPYLMYETLLPADQVEEGLTTNTADPVTGRFGPEVLAVLKDRTKFEPYKYIGRWIFLKWKG